MSNSSKTHSEENRNFWTPREDSILHASLIKHNSYREITKLLPGRTSGAACARAHFLGISHLYQTVVKPEWSEAEKEILKKNINILKYSELAKLLPQRTIDSIKRRADILGLPREGQMGPSARRSLDENFFAKENIVSAYWAGFLAADGCVATKKRCEVKLGIHVKDLSHMRRFVKDAGFDGKISFVKKICCVTICAAYQWVKDLESIYNIGPLKTFKLKPPNVQGGLALAYSIGFIDGDG